MNRNKIVFTLVLVKDEEKNNILLGYKRRGFGVNKWNGFGGKVEKGESVEEAAMRELQEESGLTAKSLMKHGIIYFDSEEGLNEMHVYTATDYDGDIHDTEEMIPKWFPLDQIPYDQMWSNTVHWLPIAIDGKKFNAHFKYGPEPERKILEYSIDRL